MQVITRAAVKMAYAGKRTIKTLPVRDVYADMVSLRNNIAVQEARNAYWHLRGDPFMSPSLSVPSCS